MAIPYEKPNWVRYNTGMTYYSKTDWDLDDLFDQDDASLRSKSTGDVEGPGHWEMLEYDDGDLLSADSNTYTSDGRVVIECSSVLAVIRATNSLGQHEYETCFTRAKADRAWDAIEELVSTWYDDDPEDVEPSTAECSFHPGHNHIEGSFTCELMANEHSA